MIPIIDTQPGFLVVHKPAGVHFHSQDGQAGLVAQLEAQQGDKLYPVHRLDTPTSGLLLLARTPESARVLTEAFTAHSVEKRYLALSDQKPKKKQGRVKGGMAKARRGAWKLIRDNTNLADTQFVSQSVSPGLRAYLLRPRSGRTHQIRVALKSLGAPILGDSLYGGNEADRLYLHALALSFALDGQHYDYWLPPTVGDAFVSPALTQQLADWQQNPPRYPGT